jgi:hypothetical protein
MSTSMTASELPFITCVDCGVAAPETDTAYTLISARFGWRLQYAVDAAGRRLPEWRCGECYRRAKAARIIP